MRKLLTYGLAAIVLTHAAAAYLVYLATDPSRPTGRAPAPAPAVVEAEPQVPALRWRDLPAPAAERRPEVPAVITYGPAPEVIQTAPAIPMPEHPEERGDALMAARQERKELAIDALNERAQGRLAAAAARKAAMEAQARKTRAGASSKVAATP